MTVSDQKKAERGTRNAESREEIVCRRPLRAVMSTGQAGVCRGGKCILLDEKPPRSWVEDWGRKGEKDLFSLDSRLNHRCREHPDEHGLQI